MLICLAREKKGAHTPELLRDFHEGGFADIDSMYGGQDNMDKIDLVTLAPELGDIQVIKKCRYILFFVSSF